MRSENSFTFEQSGKSSPARKLRHSRRRTRAVPAARFKNFPCLPRDEEAKDGASARRNLNSDDLPLTATDKLHDFVAVSGCAFGFAPFGPRQNFKVPFDGHGSGVESHLAQQLLHGSPD